MKEKSYSEIFNIELIVSIAIAYACVSSVMELYSIALIPALGVANGIVRNLVLVIMFIYQIKHYGINYRRKGLFFFALYSFYIFLYITVFPVYRLDDLKMAPSDVFNFFFRTFQTLIYILCADTIIKHFNLTKFLIVSIFISILPSLLTIQYIGVQTLQFIGNDVDMFNALPLGYCNGPLIVLCLLFGGKLFKNRIVSYMFSISIILVSSFIIFVAGERGPIIWTFVNILICLYMLSKHSSRAFIFSLIIILIIFANIDFVISGVEEISPHAAEKLEVTFKEGDTNGRFDMENQDRSTYIIGLKQFASSPIFGSYFRLITNHISFRGHYPHNIFVEILMTMGLVGFIPFLYLLWKGLAKMKKRLRGYYSENDLISLVFFLAAFLQLMTSASILFNSAFWCFFYIVCNIDMKCVEKSKKKLTIQYSPIKR